MNKSILLIHPPVVKPTEPPAGIAKLAGCLKKHEADVRLLDANLEAILFLLNEPQQKKDKWSERSYRHLHFNLSFLRTKAGYENAARYRRAVSDVNRVLEMSGAPYGVKISLADYRDLKLSPLRSADLIFAAEHPQTSPFFRYFSDRFAHTLTECPFDIVGFSLNYLSQAICTFAMIGFLRKMVPRLKIILGGGLVTSWLSRPGWTNPFSGLVDDMIAGQGEEPILNMLGLRPPAADCLPDYVELANNAYFAPGRILPYNSAGGCYWRRCAFCPEKAEQNPYRPLMPRKAADAMQKIAAACEPSLIHVVDNAISPSFLKALAQEPPGVPWYGFARITDDLANPDFCRALKQSGCTMLKLGLESGDQRVLDALQKGIDLKTAVEVLSSLRHAGIAAYVYLLFGTPNENLTQARRTLAFVAKHAHSISFLNLAVFNMPAFSADAANLRTNPFYEGDLSLYTSFDHPAGWHRGRVRNFLDREFKRHPAVAAILRRDPPFFTSNHAPFFK